MGKMRAVLSGYYGKGNGGDEALLASLLQMLPDYVTPIVLSGNPVQTNQRYGVETCDRMNAFHVLQTLRTSNALIWGGGSLIQDSTSLASPFYYGGLMGIAQQLGLKTIAWAQGIGPLKRPITRSLAKRWFGGCNAVSVRDKGSAGLLVDWQIPFTLAPDPVWALDALPVAGLWDLPAPRVAVNLRSHSTLTPTRLATLTRALIDFQKATKTFILLLPFQSSQDLPLAEILHKAIPNDSKILTLENPRELKGVFRGVEMVIGMRYHSLIMGLAEECRCFALSYDPKVTQLMDDLEIPGYLLSELPDNPNSISKTWIENYANGEPLSQNKIEYLVDRSLIHQEVLQSALQ
ncbi:polysaccharide pyruvyl transferase CsaB [Kamptonema sp. UHCC 0994]|uniref:polysaccharide pyruvyl transferase CsaB n=1 Tax=Kamptonema sp. UHCC 0994 TaxID=3031329 RepID=UPI0023B8F958|nr:polysaccharide pyruvyl transferase CsaB [Kamptonema sp. UHCC 0994]MDF0554962.1 polysaccharide pyruvyl transferase CsaB [Kamptonema sp. UHCC 0994]